MPSHETVIRFFDHPIDAKSHAEEFLSGRIRVGKLRYYKDFEASDGRGDPNEGVKEILPGNYIVSIGPPYVPYQPEKYKDIGVGRDLKIWDNDALESYMLCMSRIEIMQHGESLKTKITSSSIEKLIKSLVNTESKIVYGVLIFGGNEFMHRMMRLKVPVECKPVKYKNLSDPLKPFRNLGPFKKDNRFRRQREFRFRLQLQETEDHAYVDIGDMSEIARILDWRIIRK